MHELFGSAIDIVRLYVLRCINEESVTERPTQEDNINSLKDFTVDVKSSDRFITAMTTRELVEVYGSVVMTEFDRQFVHGGAAFLLMSLGIDQFNKLTVHLAETISLANVEPGRTVQIDTNTFSAILRTNPWLTFCVLARFTWFNQPEPNQQGA